VVPTLCEIDLAALRKAARASGQTGQPGKD